MAASGWPRVQATSSPIASLAKSVRSGGVGRGKFRRRTSATGRAQLANHQGKSAFDCHCFVISFRVLWL